MPSQANILPIAVMASGRGSNLQAIIDEIEKGNLSAEIKLVLSDKPNAGALGRAEQHGIPAKVIERKHFSSREEFNSALADEVEASGARLVCLAGFMRILSGDFISRFDGWVINIHPALLPSFPGLDAQKQALDYGVMVSGATVHFVDEGVDTGPIISQAVVNVEPHDTVETLSARILEKEHIIYPNAIRLISLGQVTQNSGKQVRPASHS
ncbi:Phosphoribosylglycinamide formyltransferase [hydrothermal vent metagenome]|uniref:phosphoribosylglycinamide formyltransferase 1 n=1 Tax=hydrothermal vent metagenome TaxID=652676 RepID=A0A3B1BSN8_9ZZZZ